jgi:hypothetical protein
MKRFLSVEKEILILWIILFVAAFMRLLCAWNFSFSPNEFSMMQQADESGIAGFFNNSGYPGTYPSGFLFFYFLWIKTGLHYEIFMRLPAIVASVGAVYLTYRIAVLWFNRYTGLMAAALLAVLQFPIMYAQQAIPFSFSMFLVLLNVYFWSKALFYNEENNKRIFLYYALSLALVGYFQNFALFFAAMVCFTGFFFVKKTNLKNYLFSVILAAVCILPEIQIILKNISLMNLSESGGWLVKPEAGMFFEFIKYSLNSSTLLIYILFAFLVYSNIESFTEIKYTKFHLLTLLWILIPLLYAYVYSRNVTPFFEYPISLFLLPFILLAFFSFANPERKKLNLAVILIVLITGIYSTTFEKKYYKQTSYPDTHSIANDISKYIDTFGKQNITAAINITSPYYINHYLKRLNTSVDFVQYRNDGHKDLFHLLESVGKSKTKYFLYAWSGVFNPHETDDVIKATFPYMIKQSFYTSSAGITLYSREKETIIIPEEKPVYYVFNGFEDGNTWDKDASRLSKEEVKYDSFSLKISPVDVYGPSCTNIFSRMHDKPIKKIRCSMWVYCEQEPKDAQIVATISFNDNDNQIFENYFWLSSKLEYFVKKGKWGHAFFTFNLPSLKSINDELKIYVWNPDKNTIYIDNFELKAYAEKL